MASTSKGGVKSISYAKYGYMFIAPFFIFYFIFSLMPLIQVFVMAFTKTAETGKSILLTEQVFNGLKNFDIVLFGGDGNFGHMAVHNKFVEAFKNTVILWIGNFIPQILLSLLLAVWFTDSKIKIRGKGVFKVIVYMPNIITAASVAALFSAMFGSADSCAANQFLAKIGVEPIDFFSKTSSFFGIGNAVKLVWFMQCWMWFGNTTLMLMSGIMGISESLFEAADIDGANSRQVFFKVTLPLLKPMMLYTLITSLIGGLQMYDVPTILGALGGNPIDTLRTVTFLISYHYNKFNYGYSGAISVTLFIITAILGSVVFFMYRDKDEIRKKKQLKKLKAQAKARAKGLGDFGI